MTILEKENELFQRWRSHSNADETTFFVQDGVLEADEYINSNIKICSILKEVPFDDTANTGYNFGEGFLKKLKEQGQEVFLKKKGTLSVLAKRINLIREIFEQNYNKDAIASLKESAYVNIKKYKGTKTSSIKDLESVATKDKDFLIEQIEEVLSPDILLCGKTRHYLGLIYGGDIQLIMEDQNRKTRLFHLYREGRARRLIIEMYHPSHRTSENELLDRLKDILLSYKESEIYLFGSNGQK
jgi:hypothetical protein